MGNEVRGIATSEQMTQTWRCEQTDRHVGQVLYLVGNNRFGFKKNRIDKNLIYH